ncbi:MAG: NIPSNAP family protein [Planctomycetaceae bacterium]
MFHFHSLLRSVSIAALMTASVAWCTSTHAAEGDSKDAGKLYELRFYTTHPGKLPDLHARFRDHTMKLFEKHGMENVIYWTVKKGIKEDGGDVDNMLVYIIAHKDEAAKDASWKAFLNDPEWKAVAANSEKNGKILAKPPRAILMRETDFSTGQQSVGDAASASSRLWELRQYNDGPERVPSTVDRFGSGEKELFTKNGMQTVYFWTATDQSAFIYLLAHKDQAAADASWKGFMTDFRPFMEQYRASHPDLPKGRGNGNEVRYLVPTDYSPLK